MAVADMVGEILQQWTNQRPDLDVSTMGIAGRLGRATRIIEREVAGYFASQGMEPWEFDVLATLRRSGPPYALAPKDLAAWTMVGSAAMTHRVDRLVAKNLVTRQTHPTNRRSVVVALTPDSLEWVDRLVEGHVANLDRVLAGVTASESGELTRALALLLATLGDVPARPPTASN